MSLRRRHRSVQHPVDDLKPGDHVFRLKGLNAFGARIRSIDTAARTATVELNEGGTDFEVPFEELEVPNLEEEFDAAFEYTTTQSPMSRICRLLTRILAGILGFLWVAQVVYDLREATFSTADSGLIVRIGFFAFALVFLLLSSRFLTLANWVLLPLGLRIPVATQSTTSQGLSLPHNWFDKIAPVGTQSKNPAVVDPDPAWNYVNKYHC